MQPGGFPHREIPNRPIGPRQHVLAAWHAMISGLKRFRGNVQRAAGVTWIAARAGIVDVVRNCIPRVFLRVRQIADRVPHGQPWRFAVKLLRVAESFNARRLAIGKERPLPLRYFMPVPIVAADPLRTQKRVLRVTGRRTSSEYNVVFRLLNAADHGVPQRRERVFLVGFRADLGIKWSFPETCSYIFRTFSLALSSRL